MVPEREDWSFNMREKKQPNNTDQSTKINEMEERVLNIKRVSKKNRGGNTIRFTALVVVGDKNGSVGTGYGKGRDVTTAITKAVSQAKRDVVNVPVKNGTIAHEVTHKYGSAQIKLKPAPKGAGIIAGGSVRTVVELAGIADISAKMLGSSNKVANVRCAIEALQKLKK